MTRKRKVEIPAQLADFKRVKKGRYNIIVVIKDEDIPRMLEIVNYKYRVAPWPHPVDIVISAILEECEDEWLNTAKGGFIAIPSEVVK